MVDVGGVVAEEVSAGTGAPTAVGAGVVSAAVASFLEPEDLFPE